EHAAERALADGDRDPLAGARDDFDQQAQVGADASCALLLEQETGQRARLAVVTGGHGASGAVDTSIVAHRRALCSLRRRGAAGLRRPGAPAPRGCRGRSAASAAGPPDRKSTRLNSSHVKISYAV